MAKMVIQLNQEIIGYIKKTEELHKQQSFTKVTHFTIKEIFPNYSYNIIGASVNPGLPVQCTYSGCIDL